MELRLSSLAGTESAVYLWHTDSKETSYEIIDTIRFVCEEENELSGHLVDILGDFSITSYESMKLVCDRYNKAVVNLRNLWKSEKRQSQLNQRPSVQLLRHVLQQCYNQAVVDPEKLNQYEPFSAEVYGETSFELVDQMIKTIKFTENDRFIDLGSGVGQVVLQVAAATSCKSCYGIEKANWPAQYAQQMCSEFGKWMKFYGKEHTEFNLIKGNFLEDQYKDIISTATVIFVNNFAFGPQVDHELKLRFLNLKEGTKIVSSKAFCAMNMQISERNLSDIGAILTVEELSPLRGPVSWTPKQVAYYLHTIDRTLLEEYFKTRQHHGFKSSRTRKNNHNAKITGTSKESQGSNTICDKTKKKKRTRKIPDCRRPSTISMISTITASISPRRFPASKSGLGKSSSANENQSPDPVYCFPSSQALFLDGVEKNKKQSKSSLFIAKKNMNFRPTMEEKTDRNDKLVRNIFDVGNKNSSHADNYASLSKKSSTDELTSAKIVTSRSNEVNEDRVQNGKKLDSSNLRNGLAVNTDPLSRWLFDINLKACDLLGLTTNTLDVSNDHQSPVLNGNASFMKSLEGQTATQSDSLVNNSFTNVVPKLPRMKLYSSRNARRQNFYTPRPDLNKVDCSDDEKEDDGVGNHDRGVSHWSRNLVSDNSTSSPSYSVRSVSSTTSRQISSTTKDELAELSCDDEDEEDQEEDEEADDMEIDDALNQFHEQTIKIQTGQEEPSTDLFNDERLMKAVDEFVYPPFPNLDSSITSLSSPFSYSPGNHFPDSASNYSPYQSGSPTMQQSSDRTPTMPHSPDRTPTIQHSPYQTPTMQYLPVRTPKMQQFPDRSSSMQQLPDRSPKIQRRPTLAHMICRLSGQSPKMQQSSDPPPTMNHSMNHRSPIMQQLQNRSDQNPVGFAWAEFLAQNSNTQCLVSTSDASSVPSICVSLPVLNSPVPPDSEATLSPLYKDPSSDITNHISVSTSIPISLSRDVLSDSPVNREGLSSERHATTIPNGSFHEDAVSQELDLLLDSFKKQYLGFLRSMKSPDFKVQLAKQIEHEKVREANLHKVATELEMQIFNLQLEERIHMQRLSYMNCAQKGFVATPSIKCHLRGDSISTSVISVGESPNCLDKCLVLSDQSMNVTALLAKDVKKEDPDLQSNQPSELLPDLEVKPDSRHRLYGRTLSPEPDMPLLTPELQPCSSIDKPTHNTDSLFRESHLNMAPSTQCISLNGMPELSVSIPLNGLDSIDEKTEMKSPDNRGPDDGGFVYSPISSVGSKKSSKGASAMCLSPISSCGSLTPDRQRNQELIDEKQAQFMSQPSKGLFDYSVWNSYFRCNPPLQPLPGALPAFDPLLPPPVIAWMMHRKDSRPYFFDGVDMLANDDDDSDKMSDDECGASSSKKMSDRKRKSTETDERVMFNKRMATMTDRKDEIHSTDRACDFTKSCVGPGWKNQEQDRQRLSSKNGGKQSNSERPFENGMRGLFLNCLAQQAESRSDSRDSGLGKESENDFEKTMGSKGKKTAARDAPVTIDSGSNSPSRSSRSTKLPEASSSAHGTCSSSLSSHCSSDSQDRYNSNQFRTYRDSVCLANNMKQNTIKRTDVNVAAEHEPQPTLVSDSCDTDSELLQGSVGLDLSKRRTASKDPKLTAPSDFSRNFARTSNSVGNERRQVSPRPASNFSDGPPVRRCRSPGKKKHLPRRNSPQQQPSLGQFSDLYSPSHDWLAQLARHAPLPGFNYGGLDPYRNTLMQFNLQHMLMPANYDLVRPTQFSFDVPMYYPTFGAGDIERNYQMLAKAVHGRRFDL